MATEIERKFLVVGDHWRSLTQGVLYRQGYLPTQGPCTVRVRVVGQQAYLTIKGPTVNHTRAEFEYEIPLLDGEEMLETLCLRPLIEKRRSKIAYRGFVWEVDEFFGENSGLIVAEIELADENQEFERPDWIGAEVTQDSKYFNASLIRYPYSQWSVGATS
ncbi:MAG: CYTH domain-containing protein [Oscillatoriales cyanobacterium RM1_1_9]|nr:CYTH domain-containing protein [Oscillatoriales cyanobacterium SM2_3_0]NJO45182.1 CYTH domain-containing protein [Oscillatoriales cyanobacterium RM2_1_1]NJO71286.1 CYTH domain-containing protein [Oscillatoriales cyanobacterium RM1_1_9]